MHTHFFSFVSARLYNYRMEGCQNAEHFIGQIFCFSLFLFLLLFVVVGVVPRSVFVFVAFELVLLQIVLPFLSYLLPIQTSKRNSWNWSQLSTVRKRIIP